MTEKLCVNCRYYFYDMEELSRNCSCGKIYYPQDIITGEQVIAYKTCQEMRNEDCGLEGRLFEERIGIVHWWKRFFSKG